MLLLLSALACETATCEKGFERHEDGLCYQLDGADTGPAESAEPDETGEPGETGDTDPAGETGETGETGAPAETGDSAAEEPTTLDDVLADLDACTPTIADGRLDLIEGCADGFCVGDTLLEAQTLFGGPDDTTVYFITYESYTYTNVTLRWDSGLAVTFDDDDADGLLEPSNRAQGLSLELPWSGGTEDGLGLGASVSCFFDALGTPDNLDFWPSGEGYRLNYAWWSRLSLSIGDSSLNGTGEDGISDGLVDRISMN